MEQNIIQDNGLLQMQEQQGKAKAFMENKWYGAAQVCSSSKCTTLILWQWSLIPNH